MLQNSRISKAIRLLKKLAVKRYRDAYVQTHTRRFLAQQMRAFRGERSQEEMGKLLDKPQSVVSRLEDPTYGKWTLTTLFDVAERLNKGVIVRFVEPMTFAEFSLDVGDEAQNPQQFDEISIRRAIARLNASEKYDPSKSLVFVVEPQPENDNYTSVDFNFLSDRNAIDFDLPGLGPNGHSSMIAQLAGAA